MADYQELFYAAKSRLHFDALSPDDDKLMVDLSKARGKYKTARLLGKLNIVGNSGLPENDEIKPQYILFGGHIGCGKTTELKRLEQDLARSDRYFTLFIDIQKEIDHSNLKYSDLLIAIGKVLVEKLDQECVPIDTVFLTPLIQWAQEKINQKVYESGFEAKFASGAKAEAGLPFLVSLFAKLTTSIRTNSTYKTEIRETVRNHFSQLADEFNKLIRHAEERCREHGKGRKLLFIVDGTDRLPMDDAQKFFNGDVAQLRNIRAHFIYCTKSRFLDMDANAAQYFDIERLPMIKLSNKVGTIKYEEAWDALRLFVRRRVDFEYFNQDLKVVDYLIEYSGGHLRHLIRLLDDCVTFTYGEQAIDEDIAREAVELLTSEMNRLIEPDDFHVLAQIDAGDNTVKPRTTTTMRLLENLLILEYNGYWWRSHPVIRLLPQYQKSLNALSSSDDQSV